MPQIPVKVRSVDQYLTILKAANRSDVTIKGYRAVLSHYAKYLKVPLGDLHNHLNAEDSGPVCLTPCQLPKGDREKERPDYSAPLHGAKWDSLRRIGI